MQIPPPRPAVASPPFDKGGTNKERFKIIYVCKAWSCRHQGKTWRFCGFPKGTLRKVASLALLTRSPQTQIICVCSSHFATHNGCPLCYEMARSSRRCKFASYPRWSAPQRLTLCSACCGLSAAHEQRVSAVLLGVPLVSICCGQHVLPFPEGNPRQGSGQSPRAPRVNLRNYITEGT